MIVENYQEVLRTKTNPKNLHMFVEAFHKYVTVFNISSFTLFYPFSALKLVWWQEGHPACKSLTRVMSKDSSLADLQQNQPNLE